MPQLQSTALLCSNLPRRCTSFSSQCYSVQASPAANPEEEREEKNEVPYLLKLFHASWVRFLGVGVALGHGALARVNPPSGCSPHLFQSFGLRFLQRCDVDRHDGAGVMELLTASEAGVRMLNRSSSVRWQVWSKCNWSRCVDQKTIADLCVDTKCDWPRSVG